MALPLPKVVADVEMGGPYVTAARGQNKLRNEEFESEINRIKAKYAPLTTRADAESKMAYARLLGPQYLAKLAANPAAMANLTEDEKKDLLQYSKNAGMYQSNGGNQLNNIPTGNDDSPPKSLVGGAWDLLMNKINPPKNNTQQSSTSNPFAQSSQSNQQAATNPLVSRGSGMMMPEHPEQRKLEQLAAIPLNNPTQPLSTYSENAGREAGIQKEGEESGKIRATDISDLNTTVFNNATKQDTLKEMASIIASPEYEQLRQVALAGGHEIAYYAKQGTKAQQNMAGRIINLSKTFVKDSARDFGGAFRAGEQSLLNDMKVNTSDTPDAARGKLEATMLMTQLLSDRAALTSKIMKKYHANKLEAMESADSQIDASAVKEKIHDLLNPTITITNNKTGEKKIIPASEKHKYGV